MGKTRKKKKEAYQATIEAIEVEQNPISVGFTAHQAESGSGAFAEPSSSISHSLGSENSWSDEEEGLEESHPAPADNSKVAEFSTPQLFDKIREPNSQKNLNVRAVGPDVEVIPKASWAEVAAAKIVPKPSWVRVDNYNRNFGEGHKLHQVHYGNLVQKRCVLKEKHV